MDTASCRQCGRSDTADGMYPWERILGMDTAPNGNDITRRSEVYPKCLAPNAVLPFLAPVATASNIVEFSQYCLVQNARAATTNTNGLHRQYATLAMEGTDVHFTSARSGELSGHTLDVNELEGLREGGKTQSR